MRFADVIGNASVAKVLSSMADNGRVAHAMLMYENEGCGALALALAYVSISTAAILMTGIHAENVLHADRWPS